MILEDLKIKARMINSLSHVDITIIDKVCGETVFYGDSVINGIFYSLLQKDIADCIASSIPKENSLHQFTSLWQSIYIMKPLFQDNQCVGYVIAGPVLRNHLSRNELIPLLRHLKIPKDNFEESLQLYSTITMLTGSEFHNFSDLINHVLESKIKPYHLIKTLNQEKFFSTNKLKKNLLKYHNFVEENYKLENQLLHAIEQGNPQGLASLFNTENRVHLNNRTPDNPIRSDKNLLLTLNTLCSRAAIKGGLPLTIAHNISTSFSIEIEKIKTSSKIIEMNMILIGTYCDMVQKYKTQYQSPLISQVISLIYQRIYEKIIITELAATLYISPEHLSRKFKKEMNEGLSQFIRRAKCDEADYLMRTNRFTLSAIAEKLQFNSPSHFSTTYKKIKGITPKDSFD